MRRHILPALAAASVVGFAGSVAARQSPEPEGKVLATPADASKEHGVLVGRAKAGGMLIQLSWNWNPQKVCGC